MAYEGFEKVKAKVAAHGGVRDPGAVAAAIGAKKYGRRKMQRAAAQGKSLRGAKPLRRGRKKRRS